MADVHVVVTNLRDLSQRRERLGELRAFYQSQPTIGRDPSCTIVLDDPEVDPVHARLSAASNHRYVHIGNSQRRHDGRAFRIGPYAIAVSEGEPGGGDISEQRRLVLAFTQPRTPKPSDARVAEHFERLGLRCTRVEYTGSFDDLRAQWISEWSAVEAQPFKPEVWQHVDRYAAHAAGLKAFYNMELFELALERVWPRPLVTAASNLVRTHLADDASPFSPLVALLEEGVHAFALPGAAMLLYGAGFPTEPLVRSLDDRASRMVYADLVEQRGQLAHATYLRADPPLAPRIAHVENLFLDARAVLLVRERRVEIPALVPSAPARHARLEGGPQTLVLQGARHAITKSGFVPLGGQGAHLILTSADGTYWVCASNYATAWINDAYFGGQTERPLLDGDTIRIDTTTYTFRI